MLVHIIANYGVGDLAFAEPVLVPVPPFFTLAAGFCIAQLGLHTAPPGALIYHNGAPREDDEAARPGKAGERLAYARLPTGIRVIGVNSGYTFSFKDVAEKFRWASPPAEGSQFRSRDVFPQAATIALGHSTALGDEIDAHALPPPPLFGDRLRRWVWKPQNHHRIRCQEDRIRKAHPRASQRSRA
jgi:hypothetical protein